MSAVSFIIGIMGVVGRPVHLPGRTRMGVDCRAGCLRGRPSIGLFGVHWRVYRQDLHGGQTSAFVRDRGNPMIPPGRAARGRRCCPKMVAAGFRTFCQHCGDPAGARRAPPATSRRAGARGAAGDPAGSGAVRERLAVLPARHIFPAQHRLRHQRPCLDRFVRCRNGGTNLLRSDLAADAVGTVHAAPGAVAPLERGPACRHARSVQPDLGARLFQLPAGPCTGLLGARRAPQSATGQPAAAPGLRCGLRLCFCSATSPLSERTAFSSPASHCTELCGGRSASASWRSMVWRSHLPAAFISQ